MLYSYFFLWKLKWLTWLFSEEICHRLQELLEGLLHLFFVFPRRSLLFPLFFLLSNFAQFHFSFFLIRWSNKECKWANSRLHLMLFVLLLLKKELRAFLLYVSFNHVVPVQALLYCLIIPYTCFCCAGIWFLSAERSAIWCYPVLHIWATPNRL